MEIEPKRQKRRSRARGVATARVRGVHASNSAIPLYAAVEKALKDEISLGVYRKGDLIPTEHDLSRQLQVSRQTVREAIRRLADAGLVSRHRGIGTRVNGTGEGARYTYPAGSLDDIVEQAREMPLRVDVATVIHARGHLAAFLRCRQGTTWLHVRGLRYHEGDTVPLAMSELYIRNRFPGLKAKLLNLAGPVHALLETHYGEIIEQVEQEIRSITAAEDVARVLNLIPGSAALEIRRRFIGKAGRLILFGHAVYPADRFSYTLNFRREAQGAQ